MAPRGRVRAPVVTLGVALGLFAAASPVFAQDTGIAVERFAPAAGPGAFGQVESAQVPVAGQLWLTSALLAIGRPLTVQNALTGGDVAQPVANRLTLDLGGEMGIWRRRLSLGLALPVSVWQNGDRLELTGAASNGVAGAGQRLQLTALGDIRLRGKAQLLGGEGPASLAVLLELTVPGGGQTDFVATSGPTLATRVLGSFRHRWLAGAANVAVRFMPERELYQTHLHDQLEWGAALGAILPVRRVGLALYTEAVGTVNLVGPGFESGTELRGALRLGWLQGSIDLGGGGGFGGLAPAWRGYLLLRTWFGERGVVGCLTRPVTF